MRIPIIAGNWKMYKTHLEAVKLVQSLWYEVSDVSGVEVVVCPPFTALRSIQTVIGMDKMNFKLGAQDVYFEEEGAFTGEISPLMLKALHVDYVIVGHSERRQYFKESDQDVNKKVLAVLAQGMRPIMCVGEPLEIREKGQAARYVEDQVVNCLQSVPEDRLGDMVIAYEPIWAIGTGRTASPEDANEMAGHIRRIVACIFSEPGFQKIRIQYGGSVKASNIKELMAGPEVDGVLVGGASLSADEFARIVRYRK
ncbi:MAG: Triosephosphate isomerase [Syntrophomonadaceae bacterium]|nr:Triosephosphate isomerase [Bacillota bacterium]